MSDANVVPTAQMDSLPTAITPMGMLQIAVSKGADIEQLTKLMDLQERYERNEAKKAYQVAFSSFKAEAVVIVKNVDITGGPLNGKQYADLFGAVDAATPALSRHGMTTTWKITKDEKDWVEVTCILTHVAGHSESASFGGPPDSGGAKNAIQARASTLTYLQRYTFLAVTGLAAGGTDDDGNGGKGNGGKGKITPTAGAGDNLDLTAKAKITELAKNISDSINENEVAVAVNAIDEAGLEVDEKIYLWTLLDSAERSALKKESKRQKDAATQKAMAAAVERTKSAVITDGQRKRLEAMISERGVSRDTIKKMCLDDFCAEHFKDLTQKQYDLVCAEVEQSSAAVDPPSSKNPAPADDDAAAAGHPSELPEVYRKIAQALEFASYPVKAKFRSNCGGIDFVLLPLDKAETAHAWLKRAIDKETQ